MRKAHGKPSTQTRRMTGSGVREAPEAGSNWRRHALPLLLLWLAALAAYSNSFENPLIFDNSPAIVQDSRVQSVTPEN